MPSAAWTRPRSSPSTGLPSAGIINNWDGHLRRYPAHDLAHRHIVPTRAWLAQHHALLPRLDGAHEGFTDVVRRRARIPLVQLAEQHGPRPVYGPTDPGAEDAADLTLTAMELASMWGAHVNGHIALNEAERRRLAAASCRDRRFGVQFLVPAGGIEP